MIDDQFDHHLHVALVRFVEKALEIVQRSIRWIYFRVVGDIVSVIAKGRWEEGQQPDAGDSEVLQIIDL